MFTSVLCLVCNYILHDGLHIVYFFSVALVIIIYRGRIEAIEFVTPNNADYLGKPIHTLKFKKDILVAAISRKKKIIFPNGDDTIEAGDSIIIVTKSKSIRSIEDIFV